MKKRKNHTKKILSLGFALIILLIGLAIGSVVDEERQKIDPIHNASKIRTPFKDYDLTLQDMVNSEYTTQFFNTSCENQFTLTEKHQEFAYSTDYTMLGFDGSYKSLECLKIRP